MNYSKKQISLVDAGIAFVLSFLLSQAFVFFATIFLTIVLTVIGLDNASISALLDSNFMLLFQNSPWLYSIISLFSQAAFFIIYLYFYKKKQIFTSTITFKKPHFNIWTALIFLIMGVLSMYALAGTVQYFDLILDFINFQKQPILEIPTLTHLFLAIFTFGIIPPICEELLFRGVILQGLKSKGIIFATIISSLMFAIFHLSAEQFIYPLLFGIFLALVMLKTNNIVYCILIHAVNNILSVLSTYFNNATETLVHSTGLLILSICLLVAWAVGMYFFYKNVKTSQKERLIFKHKMDSQDSIMIEDKITVQKRNPNLIFLVCLLAMTAFWIVRFIFSF